MNAPPGELDLLLREVRACRLCEAHLPMGPRPVLRASATARLLIVGQAPGTLVHASGIPWNDASGMRLRGWLGMDRDAFYDESKVAIVPMGFCYPGRGTTGDLPPRPECAKTWHPRLNTRDYAPRVFPLPHPSPRNVAWFKHNPWFDAAVLPVLREQVAAALSR